MTKVTNLVKILNKTVQKIADQKSMPLALLELERNPPNIETYMKKMGSYMIQVSKLPNKK